MGFASFQPEPVLSGLLILGAAMAAASVLLVFLPRKPSKPRPQRKPKLPQVSILVDGSNVMHWKNETPQIATVQAVVQALKARGFAPGVMFDANVGYKIGDSYKCDWELARLLDLPSDHVFVVPGGTPADPYLLNAARELNARIVTRDRFRDWVEAHPEVAEPGFLIRGGYRDSGELWLDDASPATASPTAPAAPSRPASPASRP